MVNNGRGKSSNNSNLGKKGEDIATAYLSSKGYKIVSRNYRCRFGEIDIIAFEMKTNCICFVEVKTRSSTKFGYPCEFVNKKKMNNITQSALVFLSENRRYKSSFIRFDIFEILIHNNEYFFRHNQNSF